MPNIVYAQGMSKPPETPRLRLVALLRVSTAGQVDGYGFDSQDKDIKRWARSTTHRIVKTLRDEAVTGRADEDDRLGLAEALTMVANGDVDGIVFPNMDRLARNMTQQEAILAVVWAHGGRAFSADGGEVVPDDEDDPMRTFVRQVMGAAAQLERGLIAKRLRNGRRNKAAQGGYAHGAPRYGQQTTKDKELAELPEEEQRRKQMERWHAEEGLGYRAIAQRANDMGWAAKRGGAWHATTVQRLLSDAAREKANAQAAMNRRRAKDEQQRARANKVLGRVL